MAPLFIPADESQSHSKNELLATEISLPRKLEVQNISISRAPHARSDQGDNCVMKQIGKFQLIKVLGKGASGTVYLALDTFSGSNVALKVLDPEVVQSPDFDRTTTVQFMTEASLAGKLSHPHIVSILEACVSEDSGYIALEYVPGGDLFQYTTPGKLLSPEDAIQIAFKCCGALDYAFRQGIVHRDIKPANIMVVSGTDIKVADFGAAYLHTARACSSPTSARPRTCRLSR